MQTPTKTKFVIPFDFKMLQSVMLYYQAGLGNWLCYEITFNFYDKVILSPDPKGAAGQKANPDAPNIRLPISAPGIRYRNKPNSSKEDFHGVSKHGPALQKSVKTPTDPCE